MFFQQFNVLHGIVFGGAFRSALLSCDSFSNIPNLSPSVNTSFELFSFSFSFDFSFIISAVLQAKSVRIIHKHGCLLRAAMLPLNHVE